MDFLNDSLRRRRLTAATLMSKFIDFNIYCNGDVCVLPDEPI
jgi:hypothetical protein